MTIRRQLTFSLAVVGLFVALLSGVTARLEWQRLAAISEAVDRVSLSAAFARMSEFASPERGATSLVLGAKDPADAAAMKPVLEQRAKTDAAFAAAGQAVAASRLPEARDLAETLRRANEGLTAIRRDADAAASQPVASRPADAATRYVQAQFLLQESLSKAMSGLQDKVSAADGEAARYVDIARLSWELRDHGGRQSTLYLNAILGGKPMADPQRQAIMLAQGRLDAIWEQLGPMEADPTAPSALRAAVAEARKGYIEEFGRHRLNTRKAAFGDGPYPMDGAEWRRMNQPLLGTIIGIRDAAYQSALLAADARRSDSTSTFVLSLVLSVLSLIALGAIALLVDRRVARPLALLTGVIRRLAEGERSLEVPYAARRDELGVLAGAVEILRSRAVEADRLTAETAASLEQREMRRQKLEARADGFTRSMTAIAQSMVAAAGSVSSNAKILDSTAEATAGQSTIVASAADEASASVGTVAAASEELHSSIHEITRQMSSAASASHKAAEQARGTTTLVHDLTQAADRIGAVVKLINDIAGQTNLLALNATIEAARAGDAGKGFAVVASEVKSLANQTAQATESITNQVNAIQAETEHAAQAIAAISGSIDDISKLTSAVAAAVEQQTAATQEIARNIQRAAAGTQDVSSSIAVVSQAASDTGRTAHDLLAASTALGDQAQLLQSEVEGFVQDLRVA